MNDKVPRREARQGRSGARILLILIGSLILAGVAWGIAEFYGIFIDEQQPVETEQSSDIPLDAPEEVE